MCDKSSIRPADKCRVKDDGPKSAMVLLYEAEQRRKKRDEQQKNNAGIEFQEEYLR